MQSYRKHGVEFARCGQLWAFNKFKCFSQAFSAQTYSMWRH